MNGIYGVTERNRLRTMAEIVQAHAPGFWENTPEFTDALRANLPDIDDVTIGRVLNEIAAQIASLEGTGFESVPAIHTIFTCAGLQMTREEWEDA